MKIVITGETGFVGMNLVKYLSEKPYQVQGLNLRNTKWKSKIDPQSDVIIHLAGRAYDSNKSSNPKDFFDINTKLSQELFDVFLNNNCRNFIFFSSIKAVTDKTEEIVTEETSTNPQTFYGQSKLKAEHYILGKALPQGKRVFILRPSMIHGPGNNGNLNLLFQLVNKGLPWPLGAFQNQRSFCSMANVCFLVQQLLERENVPSGVYNIADDEAISTNELITLIARASNKNVKIYAISKQLIHTIAKIGDIVHLPLNTERLEKLTENFVVSNAKIKAALEIKKLPISAKEGLAKTIQSLNNE